MAFHHWGPGRVSVPEQSASAVKIKTCLRANTFKVFFSFLLIDTALVNVQACSIGCVLEPHGRQTDKFRLFPSFGVRSN